MSDADQYASFSSSQRARKISASMAKARRLEERNIWGDLLREDRSWNWPSKHRKTDRKATAGIPVLWREAFEAKLDYPTPIQTPPQHQLRHTLASFEIQGTAQEYVHVKDADLLRQMIAQASRYRPNIRTRNMQVYPGGPPSIPDFPNKPTPAETLGTPNFPDWQPPSEPTIFWYERLFYWIADKKRLIYKKSRERAHKNFEQRKLIATEDQRDIEAFNSRIEQLNEDRLTYWQLQKQEYDIRKNTAESVYSEDKARWDAHELSETQRCRQIRAGYERGTSKGIDTYFRAMLNAMPVPGWFPKEYVLHIGDDGVLVIDLALPYFEALPVKKTRHLASGEKLADANKSETKRERATLPYLCALRYLWEIPKIDDLGFINYVCINGHVEYDDPATGNRRRDTIMSVAATTEEIDAIQLDKVDPQACFVALKGVSASRIDELVPVQPILNFDREDKRFREAEDVLDQFGDENLATMDWQEFEHLIRELFEKVFSGPGAEVKVTQASRDRGVDAVVFDPDPIRGGKFVVQAKRYANVVDVSAVRDLYGTVLNEGASKGILVTTSNYGRDAYEFAKDKPLTLLNGQNLLHLLEEHGYRLRLDLKEARRLLKTQSQGKTWP